MKLRINYLDIECLPKLKDFDMAKLGCSKLSLIGDLPQTLDLVYPNLKDMILQTWFYPMFI